MGTIRIKSTHPETQGEFVVIEENDFDADTMEYFEASDAPKRSQGRPKKVDVDLEDAE
jgi:hypothetical protein